MALEDIKERMAFPKVDLAASAAARRGKAQSHVGTSQASRLWPQSPPNSVSQPQNEMRKVGLQPLVLS